MLMADGPALASSVKPARTQSDRCKIVRPGASDDFAVFVLLGRAMVVICRELSIKFNTVLRPVGLSSFVPPAILVGMEITSTSDEQTGSVLRPVNLVTRLRLPMFGAPMFLISSPELVLAQCKAGIVGTLPCLNLRPAKAFHETLQSMTSDLGRWDASHPEQPSAPLAVNLMVHVSNTRLEEDLAIIRDHRVPVVITSLNSPDRVVQAIKSYGGLIFHDVSQVRHARRAAAAGVDGLVLVCAGSGGHTGQLSPFAFIAEVREFFTGAVALAGAIRNGSQVAAIRVLGADFAYCGSAFIASDEAWAAPLYKEMVTTSGADDIVVSTAVTGLRGSYLRKSFDRLGLDPEQLSQRQTATFDLAITPEGTKAKAWKDVWSAGQGVGGTRKVQPAKVIVEQFASEYAHARAQLRATL